MMNRYAALLSLLLLPALPSSAIIAINGSLGRQFEVAPGKSYEGVFEVGNPDDQAQEIRIYQTDYSFFADGTVMYGQPGKLPRSNARWITLSPQRATIPAKQSITIRYTIQVPPDDALRGTYWSIVMVEPVAPGTPESATYDPGQVTVGIREVLRYGMQIVTTVGSTGTSDLKFTRVRLQEESGKQLLVVDIQNTGERWLQPDLRIDLYDAKGGYVGAFQGGAHRLYPGTAARFTVPLLGLTGSTYKAVMVADSGDDDVFGANIDIVLRP